MEGVDPRRDPRLLGGRGEIGVSRALSEGDVPCDDVVLGIKASGSAHVCQHTSEVTAGKSSHGVVHVTIEFNCLSS